MDPGTGGWALRACMSIILFGDSRPRVLSALWSCTVGVWRDKGRFSVHTCACGAASLERGCGLPRRRACHTGT